MKLFALPLLLALSVSTAAGAPEWVKLSSSNFEMYTNAGAKDARKALEYFEQVRDVFMRIKSQQVTTRLPVTIVAFRNEKDYKPYAVHENALAYFTGDEQRDYIVMSGIGSENYPVAVHEYMHLLIRHSGLKLPVWLNEGLAEVHSTVKPRGGQILIGTAPENRAFGLVDGKWFPLSALLTIDRSAPEFDERNRGSLFYAQSWLLTHMLMLSETYRQNFGKFVLAVSSSGNSEAAFQQIYGKSLQQVTSDLRTYFKSNSIPAIAYDLKLQKIEVGEPVPASEFDTELILTRLTALLRRKHDAELRYSDLARAYPNRWEVFEARAHLHWHEGDNEKARQYLRRAMELKSTSWKTYWDYARLAQDDPEILDTLRTALRLNPDLAEARLMLGYELYNRKMHQEALDVLSGIKQITSERAHSFFLMKAYAAMELGKTAEAKSSALSAIQHAKNPGDAKRAQQVVDFIDRPQQQAARVDTVFRPPSDLGMEIRPERESASDVQAVRGVLEAIECLGEQARMQILTGNTRIWLLIRSPDRVRLKNSDDSTVSFQCGPQTNTRVIVEYIAKEDEKFKTSGDIVGIEFTVRKTSAQ